MDDEENIDHSISCRHGMVETALQLLQFNAQFNDAEGPITAARVIGVAHKLSEFILNGKQPDVN